jgi:hypothetical protein
MSRSFSVESVSCLDGNLGFAVRNIRNIPLNANLVAFLDNSTVSNLKSSSKTIAVGAVEIFNATGSNCSSGSVLRVTIEYGESWTQKVI